MLDAPVSGGDVGAIEGHALHHGGRGEEDFERRSPLFEVMGYGARMSGPVGTGQVVKAANQIVVALTIEAVSEALVLGLQGRGRAGEDAGRAWRGARWQQGHGGQAGEDAWTIPSIRAFG